MRIVCAVLLVLVVGLAWQLKTLIDANRQQTSELEGYRVVGYEAATHEWTILRNGTFDGKYLKKRISVICESYTWAGHQSVWGPEACHLQVGQLIKPNPMPENARDFVDVFEMPGEILSITEGHNAEEVMQQFKILKYEVLEGQ